MPKLLQINSVVNTGSTGRIAEQLGQMALSEGWDSYIAYGREAKESKSRVIRIGSKFDVFVHVIASRFFDYHGLMSRLATNKFLRQIDEIKPDIVHIHNMHGYYLNYPMLLEYLKAHAIPTVITLHDFWLMTGHCAYINKSCSRWRNGCGKCPRTRQYPASILDHSHINWQWKEAVFNEMPNLILIPVSKWLNSYVEQSLLKNIKSEVIYNGIDTDIFKPYTAKERLSFKAGKGSMTDIDWGKFTIISIATRWTDANGYGDVMRLSSILPQDSQMIVVGLDDKQLQNLPDNVIGFKKTENLAQLRELYTFSDVLYNPNSEVTFGLVTVEAMACGTPAIVLKNTAGEELVDKDTGYVVNSVEEVLELIPYIQKNDKLVVRAACRNRVEQFFNASKQFHKYIDLYNNLLEA